MIFFPKDSVILLVFHWKMVSENFSTSLHSIPPPQIDTVGIKPCSLYKENHKTTSPLSHIHCHCLSCLHGHSVVTTVSVLVDHQHVTIRHYMLIQRFWKTILKTILSLMYFLQFIILGGKVYHVFI